MSDIVYIIVGALAAQGILHIIERLRGDYLSPRVANLVGMVSACAIGLALNIVGDLA